MRPGFAISLRDASVLVAIALAIAGSAWFSLDLTRVHGGVAAIWISNGLLLGVMLRRPVAQWPWLFVLGWIANVVPRLAHGDPLAMSIGLSTVDLIEVATMVFAIRRRIPDIDDPQRLLSLSKVAATSAVAACLLSATLAALVLATSYRQSLAGIWLTWFSAHLLGVVIVGTIAVVALREGSNLLGRPGARRDFATCLLLLVVTCVLVFGQQRYPLLFLIYLPLLLLTFRHRLAGVVMGMLVLLPVTGVAAILQIGPFALVRAGGVLERALLGQIFIGAGVLLALPVALVLTARHRLAVQVRENEGRYRLLAEHAQDVVVRLREDGGFAYVSPSIRNILGWEPHEFRHDLVHPDDRQRRDAARKKLWEQGGDTKITYRMQHKAGHYVWLEVLGTRIQGEGGMAEIVYAARDIDARVAAQQAMARSQQRLQTLIDSIPATVAYVDAEQHYTFANAAIGRMLGVDPASMVGRSMREVRSPEDYAAIEPFVEAALRGEQVSFSSEERAGGQYYQATYVPDVGDDGVVRGFHALAFDITPLKRAERALEQLAREDALTGLANRRQFEERLEQAVIRARRQELPLALMLLDIDHFKAINDRHGHPAGDTVLRMFAERIRASVYDVDMVARLGGDEFAVLVEYVGGIQEMAVIARKILKAMEAPIAIGDGVTVRVGTSIGIGFQREAEYGLTLVALADRALYAAKQAGRNTFRELHD